MTSNQKITPRQYNSLVKKLGKEKDIVLSELYHVTRERIRQIRTKLGIPVSPNRYNFRKRSH